MFGSNKQKRYANNHSLKFGNTRRPSRWLALLGTGVILGAAGFWFIETNYGSKRLTIQQSIELTNEINNANNERQRLQAKLEQAAKEVNTLSSTTSSTSNTLSEAKLEIGRLQEQINLLKQSFPAVPRNQVIDVRSAEISQTSPTSLQYKLLVLRRDQTPAQLKTIIDFNIEGRYPNRTIGYIKINPIHANVESFQQLKGSLEIKPDFTPRQINIKIRDAETNKIIFQRLYTYQAEPAHNQP